MSMNAALRARLARLGPVRDAAPPPSFSGEPVALVLRLVGVLDQPISAIKRLHDAGLTLRAAHAVVDRLAEARLAVCHVAEGANVRLLAADLAAFNIRTYRQRQLDPGLIAEVRTRHGLSQREFAGVLGLDVDTLQNWEQGRYRPDEAALRLVMAFDQAPELIENTVLQPVA